jgi:hypothetical protein
MGTQLSARRFGLTVGSVFLVLAGVSYWRGHGTVPLVLGSLGVLLVVPGLVAPAILVPVERVWMRGAMLLGEVNARIILTVLFYLVIAPLGFVLRRFRDPLDRSLHDGRTSDWTPRPPTVLDPARYERQF